MRQKANRTTIPTRSVLCREVQLVPHPHCHAHVCNMLIAHALSSRSTVHRIAEGDFPNFNSWGKWKIFHVQCVRCGKRCATLKFLSKRRALVSKVGNLEEEGEKNWHWKKRESERRENEKLLLVNLTRTSFYISIGGFENITTFDTYV